MKSNVIVIHPDDNVAVTLEDIGKGDTVIIDPGRRFPALCDIAYSHKVLLNDVAAGGDIKKYGEVIGQAKSALKQGDWVHTHNMNIDEV